MSKRMARTTVRVDARLRQKIDKTAEDLGLSRKSMLRLLIQRALGPALVYQHLSEPSRADMLWENARNYHPVGPRTELSVELPRKVLEVVNRLAGVRQLNSFVCDLLVFALPHYEAEAKLVEVCLDTKDFLRTFDYWKAAGRVQTPLDFDREMRKQLLAQTLRFDPFRLRKLA